MSKWVFDSNVADRFEREAVNHIPGYHRVIKETVTTVTQSYPTSARILDVGSAIGTTVQEFHSRGYTNAYGLEKSSDMIAKSRCGEHIIHGDKLPSNMMWDVVVCNWTLHFIHDRSKFLQQIYNQLLPDGLLIITDKMRATKGQKEAYYQFKSNNGITLEEIAAKEKSLKGVLTVKPLSWYTTTLNSIGFVEIVSVTQNFMFHTLRCNKPC